MKRAAVLLAFSLLISACSALPFKTDSPGEAAPSPTAPADDAPLPPGIATAPVAITLTPATVKTGPLIGQQAPPIALKTLSGDDASLDDFAGQPVIINFWASWCVPCKDEMPALQAIYERYKDEGLVILGVNSTFRDTVDAAQDFVDETGATFPILLDTDDEAYKAYRVQGLPTSFLISPDGMIQWVQIGPLTEETLDRYIRLMLIPE